MGKSRRAEERELELLRTENKALKKQLARMQKLVARHLQSENRIIEEDPQPQKAKKVAIKGCPQCSDAIKHFITPTGTKIVFCPSCKWRGKDG